MFSTRSIFATLLLIAASLMMVEQGHALISVDTASRRSATPKLSSQESHFQRPEMEVAKTNPLTSQVQDSFDTDAYRQAMTELVYQRSMERFS